MITEPFRFKQFSIHHQRSSMKVGTDGVLLGAWAEIQDKNQILDIGTGSGLIALMCAQRNPDAIIHGVEIDKEAYEEAVENGSNCTWSERIKFYNMKIQDFESDELYESIISNPPYFKHRVKSKIRGRDKARDAEFLPQVDLLISVKRLLRPNGTFQLIYPYQAGKEIIALAKKQGFYPRRMTVVRSRKEMEPERLLIELHTQDSPIMHDELSIYQSGKKSSLYTDDYISLTKDFYLYI